MEGFSYSKAFLVFCLPPII